MKNELLIIAALGALGSGAAFAQQATDQQTSYVTISQAVQRAFQASYTAAVSGAVVLHAPYSATGTTESTQTLSDGTHIRNQSQYTIYRDADGRERRDTATEIVISDPVAHTSYILDPVKQTYQTRPLNMVDFNYSPKTVTLDGKQVSVGVAAGAANISGTTNSGPATRDGRGGRGSSNVETESLGTRNIQGVNAMGTRRTTTFPEGSIGNDRPIQTVNERWTSPELQVTVMTKSSDPRTGETLFQLTNINRNPPEASLFQIPPGYQPAPASGGRGRGAGGGGEPQ